MKTRLSTKGQIVLPAELRQSDRLRAGQEFLIERIEPGVYELRRIEGVGSEGVVDWLLDCPSRGYFVPIESESTDEI